MSSDRYRPQRSMLTLLADLYEHVMGRHVYHPGQLMDARRRAGNVARDLREIAAGNDVRECIYVAVDESGAIIGLAMGCPATADDLPQTGAINALTVRNRTVPLAPPPTIPSYPCSKWSRWQTACRWSRVPVLGFPA